MSAPAFAFPQPLAEKYRPTRIAEFVGLERPKKVLAAFCKRPTSGAWIFKGPSGVGKSTMALALVAELEAELHKIPSQKCTAQSIEDAVRQCWYAPMMPGGFHVVLVDEADAMTPAGQLQLLSKLDSVDPGSQHNLDFYLQRYRTVRAALPLPLQDARIFQLRDGWGYYDLSRQCMARGRRKRELSRLVPRGEKTRAMTSATACKRSR